MASIAEYYKTDIAFESDYLRTATGDIDTISGIENLRQALFHRLITTPGTLIHRPGYGVGIKDFIGAPMNVTNKIEIASRIEEQLLLDDRFEQLLGVSFSVPNNNPELLEIVVRVKPRGYDEQQFQFTPFGEAS